MTKVGVVTVARSDYGIYRPVLDEIESDPKLELEIYVSGMHLSPEFGQTVDTIEEDGYNEYTPVEMLVSSDTPEGVGKSVGLGTISFSQALARDTPDVLLVLGDRFEMLAAVTAALPMKIPVAHVHGGESTEAAIDEGIRHAITKLSHLHFCATDTYRRRIIQMGEEPWRVVTSGAPSLDNIMKTNFIESAELEELLDIRLTPAPLLVTFHPVTLEHEETGKQVKELIEALRSVDRPQVITYPNADTRGHLILDLLERYVDERDDVRLVDELGIQAYFSLMRDAAAMVGNSSSGLIEAPSFDLPVVNVGNRQRGRIRGENVIDVGYRSDQILEGIQRALDSEMQSVAAEAENPYGRGQAATTIVDKIKDVSLDDNLVIKTFHDLKAAEEIE